MNKRPRTTSRRSGIPRVRQMAWRLTKSFPRRASPRRPAQGDADRGSRPKHPTTQTADAGRTRSAKKQEAHARRVRQSLKKYLRRKREALKPKVEAAKKCAGCCSLEVFDEDTNLWRHMRVNRVDVKWLEGGAYRRVRRQPRRRRHTQASRAASGTKCNLSTTWKGCRDRPTGWI